MSRARGEILREDLEIAFPSEAEVLDARKFILGMAVKMAESGDIIIGSDDVRQGEYVC